MKDRYFMEYLKEMENRNDKEGFLKVKDSLECLEKDFGVWSVKYGWLPPVYDNRHFKEQFIRRRCAYPFRNEKRWASHIAALKAGDNEALVLFSPSLHNKLTVGIEDEEECLETMYEAVAQDVQYYNAFKQPYAPRLSFAFLDLKLYSSDTVSILLFKEGYFDKNEQARKHFSSIRRTKVIVNF